MHYLILDPNFVLPGFGEATLLKHKSFIFNGGEAHIKIEPVKDVVTKILVIHRINNSQNLMELLLAADALRRQFEKAEINCLIPYIPYARQDRPMVDGEPFSLNIFAKILALANFNKVFCLDPHSDVSAALIPNLVAQEPTYLKWAAQKIERTFGEYVLIAPDGGALKKIYKNAKYIGYKGNIYCAGKVRNVDTGEIVRMTLDATPEELNGKTVWIQDDICSKGGTFMALSKVLKERGAKHVVLSVSHYEGVADETALRESGIDKVYTTDSKGNGETEMVRRFNL